MQLTLVKTCDACPEQYDVFDAAGVQVGYLRLRHGLFTAQHISSASLEPEYRVVHSSLPKGVGEFFDEERDTHLAAALDAIRAEILRRQSLDSATGTTT